MKRFVLLGPLVGWALIGLPLTVVLAGVGPGDAGLGAVLLVIAYGVPTAYMSGGIPALLTGLVVRRWDRGMARRRYALRAAAVGAAFGALCVVAPNIVVSIVHAVGGQGPYLIGLVGPLAAGAALGFVAAGVCALTLSTPSAPGARIKPRPNAETMKRRSDRYRLLGYAIVAAALLAPVAIVLRGPSPETRRELDAARARAEAERRTAALLAKVKERSPKYQAPPGFKLVCRWVPPEVSGIATGQTRCRGFDPHHGTLEPGDAIGFSSRGQRDATSIANPIEGTSR